MSDFQKGMQGMVIATSGKAKERGINLTGTTRYVRDWVKNNGDAAKQVLAACREREMSHDDTIDQLTAAVASQDIATLERKFRESQVLVAHLQSRQEEHLKLIALMSKESISPDEAGELRKQMGALIAEVGTLRAELRK